MTILAGAVALMGIGTIVVFVIVYIYLTPNFSRYKYGPIRLGVLCHNCLILGERRYIRGCNHIGGVPSTWHHRDNGSHYCSDGVHEAWHA
jgi:hypothetical protein